MHSKREIGYFFRGAHVKSMLCILTLEKIMNA
jgi:hypothetical protein